jgi:hypothetical protein
MSVGGAPPPRFVICSSVLIRMDRRNPSSCRRPQHDPLRHLASGRQAPQRDQQLAREGEDHGLAGSHAAIVGLQPTGLTRGGARLEPFDQGALFLEAHERQIAACRGEPGHCRYERGPSRGPT